MKFLRFGKLITMGLVVITLSSCQEEEFYEKDYIDSAIDQYERENTIIENEVPGVEEPPVTEPPVVEPPVVTPPPVVEPPVVTPPPVVEPPVVTPPPVVEPPVVTPPPVVEPPVVTPPPVVEPPVVTPPPVVEPPVIVPPTPETEEITNAFDQVGENAKIDILWVVDNSGSMGGEQRDLASNFQAFIKDFTTKDIDFKMAITTTDRERSNRRTGSAVRHEKLIMEKLTSEAMKADPQQFMDDFKKYIKVGTRGYHREKGLKSSEIFTDKYSKSFLRDDAYLIVVYVSDESDQSEKTVAGHLKQLTKWKNNAGLVKTYSIVNMKKSERYYKRYKEMSDLTGGYIASLYENFSNVLSNMGESIVNLSEQFPLSDKPLNSNEIKVKVNGIEVNAWDYIEATNAIKFHANAIPANGSNIEIKYDVLN
jgi:hypothetical protein